ncbi:MAG: methyltransferase [Verrucomicrobiota bacterium]
MNNVAEPVGSVLAPHAGSHLLQSHSHPHPHSPSPSRILETGLAFWNSKTLLTATELGVFTLLAHGPLDGETLREKLHLHSRSAADFFDALVAMKFLDRRDGKYSNTAETDLFLDRNKPSYVGGILEMCSRRLFKDWSELTPSLKSGSRHKENTESAFEELYSTPAKLEEFLKGMTGISLGTAGAIAAKFPWARYKTFIDVGAAQGAVPMTLARSHPHLSGTGFDLPAVGPIFEKYIRDHGVADRVRFKPGDFFKDPLPTADVIIMGHILHDWDLPTKKMLVQKVHDALPSGGAFIVYEALIDDDRRENAFGLLMSLNMLIETPGGFDYTGAQGQCWMREAGFRETRVEHLLGPDSMIVGIK